MKRITLIRHAKSSWKHDVIDHQRPLNNRGINDANLIGQELKSSNYKFDLILTSDAVRTKLTSEIILSILGNSDDLVQFKHELYDFAGSGLVDSVKTCDHSVKHLLLFGHNYAITNFVNTYGDICIDNVPTCGVVTIEFPQLDWKYISNGKTVFTLFPKDLK